LYNGEKEATSRSFEEYLKPVKRRTRTQKNSKTEQSALREQPNYSAEQNSEKVTKKTYNDKRHQHIS